MKRIKMIPPFVMLAATALVAAVTYLRDLPFSTWLILVFGVMVLFLFIGEVIVQLILYFDRKNREQERQEEEARKSEEEQSEQTEADAEIAGASAGE